MASHSRAILRIILTRIHGSGKDYCGSFREHSPCNPFELTADVVGARLRFQQRRGKPTCPHAVCPEPCRRGGYQPHRDLYSSIWSADGMVRSIAGITCWRNSFAALSALGQS